MIYVFYSKEPEMARHTGLKYVRKAFPVRDQGNYISFNMAVSTIEDVLNECMNMSLISERKAVFCENCAFLAKPAKGVKAAKDKSLQALASYCKNPNPDVELYLIVYSGALDTKNPVVEAISQNGQIKEIPVPKESEWVQEVIRSLTKRGNVISQEAAEELVKRVGGDYGRFLNELAKLDAFGNQGEITYQDICTLVSPRPEDKVYMLSNALLANNTEEALRVYADLKRFGSDEVGLLSMLARQFSTLEQIQYLSSTGMSSNDIATTLGESSGRVYACLKDIRKMKPSAIPITLERIYRCQKNILSGESRPEFAFTYFIAKTSFK